MLSRLQRKILKINIPHAYFFDKLLESVQQPQKNLEKVSKIPEIPKNTGYTQDIDEKIKMFKSITKEKWDSIHKSAPQYTIYLNTGKDIKNYSMFLWGFRVAAGSAILVNMLIWSGYGFMLLGPTTSIICSASSIMSAGILYWIQRNLREGILLKITYDTQKQMFCFHRVAGDNKIQQEWVKPSDIGINLYGKEDQDWLYYNRKTYETYPTIGQGKWINEEILLYSLLQSNKKFKGVNPETVKIQAKPEQKQINKN